jgi:hypothetical protein
MVLVTFAETKVTRRVGAKPHIKSIFKLEHEEGKSQYNSILMPDPNSACHKVAHIQQ